MRHQNDIPCALDTVLTRLIDSAIRRGAGRIAISTGNSIALVEDDGAGAPNPIGLLSADGQREPGATDRRGLRSLTGRSPCIWSRVGTGMPWAAHLDDHQLTGRRLITVKPARDEVNGSPRNRILFNLLQGEPLEAEQDARTVAAGYTTPITVDGVPVQNQAPAASGV